MMGKIYKGLPGSIIVWLGDVGHEPTGGNWGRYETAISTGFLDIQ